MRKLFASALLLATTVLVACGGGEPARSERSAGSGALAAEVDSVSGAQEIVMTVPSMSCPLCVNSIRSRLENAGLGDIRIDLDTKLVRARFDSTRISADEVEGLVESQGFPVRDSRVLTVRMDEGSP